MWRPRGLVLALAAVVLLSGKAVEGAADKKKDEEKKKKLPRWGEEGYSPALLMSVWCRLTC